MKKATDKIRVLCRAAVLMALAALWCAPLRAQNEAQLTQYWAVPTYYNPARTGETDFIRVNGGAKLQWLGITHAPMSFLLAADMPVKVLNKRIGVGVTGTYEQLGLFVNFGANAQLSYKIPLFKGVLSVGVQGGYVHQRFKGSEVQTPDNDDYHSGTDEAIPTQDLAGHSIDVSAGISYTHKWFWFSASCLHITQPTIRMSIEGSESTETKEFSSTIARMAYFSAGSNIPIKNTLFELQPSLMVKTDFNMFTAEVTARVTYNKMISFGVGYRWKEAISGMVAVEFKNFFIGYAYDYPLSALGKASWGSHEMIAGYRFKLDLSKKNNNKHRSIRIM